MATRTRNRTSRLAVLDSSVRRPASTSSTARSRSPLLRRAVVIGLVVLSLALITVSFRETSGGPAPRRAERRGRGDEAVRGRREPRRAARSATPTTGSTASSPPGPRTSSSGKRSRALRQQYATAQSAQNENATLQRLLDYERGPSFPKDFRAVNASVIARGAPDVQQRDHRLGGLEAGRARQRSRRDDRRSRRQVTRVAHGLAQVTLLTDATSAVAASDLTTKAYGLVQHGPGSGDAARVRPRLEGEGREAGRLRRDRRHAARVAARHLSDAGS